MAADEPKTRGEGSASLADLAFCALQRGLPTRAMSTAMHRLTRLRTPWLKDAAIRGFVRAFDISLDQAQIDDPRGFDTFNAFFTRALKPGMRSPDPDPDAMLSPCDGDVSQFGRIDHGRIIQAKGHDYNLLELVGGYADVAEPFADGCFATIYLAPWHYHRLHMPLTGTLREWIHVPGRLFSVNPATARGLPRVFARNERVIAIFETAIGPIGMVLVGALFVGSIETVWAGEITPPHRRHEVSRHVPSAPVSLQRFAEFGRFNMGSTVILLTPPGLTWADSLRPRASLLVGQKIASLVGQ